MVYIPSLHNVRRTSVVAEGGFVACDGAWNRKGQIVEVTEVVCPKGTKAKIRSGCGGVTLIPVVGYYEVRIRGVGSYWADGRYTAPSRPSFSTKRLWQMPGGRLIQQSGWVPVVPV